MVMTSLWKHVMAPKFGYNTQNVDKLICHKISEGNVLGRTAINKEIPKWWNLSPWLE